jgi:hypothetical protein
VAVAETQAAISKHPCHYTEASVPALKFVLHCFATPQLVLTGDSYA